VPETKTHRRPAFDDEQTSVLGSMMRAAQNNQIVRSVVSTVGAKLEMVEVQKSRVRAARNYTTTKIPTHHCATHCRWDILFRSNSPNLLCIAFRHLNDLVADFRELAASLLESSRAVFANGDRQLITRTTFLARSTEYVSSREHEQGIVVEVVAGLAPELRNGFSKRGQGLSCHFEPKHMAFQLRANWR
jgi:hypothetical protein